MWSGAQRSGLLLCQPDPVKALDPLEWSGAEIGFTQDQERGNSRYRCGRRAGRDFVLLLVSDVQWKERRSWARYPYSVSTMVRIELICCFVHTSLGDSQALPNLKLILDPRRRKRGRKDIHPQGEGGDPDFYHWQAMAQAGIMQDRCFIMVVFLLFVTLHFVMPEPRRESLESDMCAMLPHDATPRKSGRRPFPTKSSRLHSGGNLGRNLESPVDLQKPAPVPNFQQECEGTAGCSACFTGLWSPTRVGYCRCPLTNQDSSKVRLASLPPPNPQIATRSRYPVPSISVAYGDPLAFLSLFDDQRTLTWWLLNFIICSFSAISASKSTNNRADTHIR
ncbi:hypothetical protein V8F06_006947 [Rhypophila decipiens]